MDRTHIGRSDWGFTKDDEAQRQAQLVRGWVALCCIKFMPLISLQIPVTRHR
jgi:hypothetical protein